MSVLKRLEPGAAALWRFGTDARRTPPFLGGRFGEVLLGKGQRGGASCDAPFLIAYCAMLMGVNPLKCLPKREGEVCKRLLRGWTYDGVAVDLGISAGTVKIYRDRAFDRLGIHHRNELFAWALAWSSQPLALALADRAASAGLDRHL